MPSPVLYHITKRQKTLQQIHELYFIKRWNAVAIAQALGLKPFTVRNWIRFINKRRQKIVDGKEMDLMGVTNWTMEVRDYYFECMKQAWNEFAKSTSPKERMACMDRAMSAFKDYFDSMQKMGIAPSVRNGEDQDSTPVTYKSLLKSADGNIQVVEIKQAEVVEEKPNEKIA